MLSAEQLDEFIELGFCTLRHAFKPEHAASACDRVWDRIAQKAGIQRDDPRTWPENYTLEEYVDAQANRACFTDTLVAAIETLVGPDRWSGPRSWGFWPVNFSQGADERDAFPDWGWHIDGRELTHTLDAPHPGLLVIGMFTDVAPGSGGTSLALGSHQTTARLLARYPQGIPHDDLLHEILREPIGNFCETTGEAGDVVLAHPYLFHARGYKRSGPPRIISVAAAPLRDSMRLDRSDGDYSVLETSILRALSSEAVTPQQGRLCRS
jgi:hypothetical protein